MTVAPAAARRFTAASRPSWWRRSRLAEQQYAGSEAVLAARELHKHPRQMRALLLAARQSGDRAIRKLAKVELGERRIDQRFDAGAAPMSRRHAHDIGDGERKGDMDLLRQHRAVRRQQLRREAANIAALQADYAGTWFEFAG